LQMWRCFGRHSALLSDPSWIRLDPSRLTMFEQLHRQGPSAPEILANRRIEDVSSAPHCALSRSGPRED
jgi:hypothetical protein